MNIPTTIEVLTVISSDAKIIYQQVYVNRTKDAMADYKAQLELYNDLLSDGYNVVLQKF